MPIAAQGRAAALGGILLVTSALPAAEYFVSAGRGDDGNPGTEAAPLRTISKALALARPGDTCTVRRGVYRESVRVPRDGAPGKPIHIVARAGEAAVVTGADRVRGWTPWKDRIHRAAAGGEPVQLFVDGAMMVEARWPNTGPDLLKPTLAEADSGRDNAVLVDDDLTQPDGFWDGARLHITPGSHWISWTRTVKGYSRATHELEFDAYARAGDGAYQLRKGSRYFLAGKLGALDAPGEWFHDAKESLVYLWAPAGDEPEKHVVEVKRRDLAFDLTGRSWIELKGFRIFAATIRMVDSRDCLVEDCHIRYASHFVGCDGWGTGMDSTGIVVSGSGNEIRRSSVVGSAGNGITLLGERNGVVNCLVRNVDYAAVDCGAIRARGRELLITCNTLCRAGRSVLVHRELRKGRIERNDMYDAGLLASDLGVTYCFQTDGEGTIIAWNRVHDNRAHTGVGIYIDNGSPNHVIHHNVCYRNADSGIRLNTPTANVLVYDNTVWKNGNSLGWWGAQGNEEQPGVVVVNNILTDSVSLGRGAVARNNFTTGDPGFVDPEKGDFSLREGSPCIDAGELLPGFTDGYRARAPDIGAFESGERPWYAGHDWGEPPPAWIPES